MVDDFVVRRGDGGYAYNLAVVVDDADAQVDQVVRGDDLLPAAVNQAWLARAARPDPADVRARAAGRERRGGAAGQAGRSGHPGRAGRSRHGPPADVLSLLAVSLGLAQPGEPVELTDLLSRFDPARLPRRALGRRLSATAEPG